MNCWHCGQTADGACQFCGRGLCKEHAREMPFILEVWVDSNKIPDVLAVEGALFCGICKPQRQPLEMPELD